VTSLLDPRDGVAAADVRRAVGLDPVMRVEDLERKVAALERTLANVMRVFRGFAVEGNKAYVTPEPDTGWVRIHSLDSSVTITDEPIGGAHNINLEVATPGCTAAYATRCHDDGTTVGITECLEDDGIVGETTARTCLRVETYGLSSPPPVTGIAVIGTATAQVTESATHLVAVPCDDGNMYKLLAVLGDAAGDPAFPDCQ